MLGKHSMALNQRPALKLFQNKMCPATSQTYVSQQQSALRPRNTCIRDNRFARDYNRSSSTTQSPVPIQMIVVTVSVLLCTSGFLLAVPLSDKWHTDNGQ